MRKTSQLADALASIVATVSVTCCVYFYALVLHGFQGCGLSAYDVIAMIGIPLINLFVFAAALWYFDNALSH